MYSDFRSTPISLKVEESIFVLLIKNEERWRIIHQFDHEEPWDILVGGRKMGLGIYSLVVEQWGQLAHTLKKIKYMKMKGYHAQHHQRSSSGISDLGLQDCLSKCISCNSSNRAKEVHPLMSAMDGKYNMLSLFRKTNTNLHGASPFILLVIDTTAGPCPKLCKIVTEFKRGIQNAWCRSVDRKSAIP